MTITKETKPGAVLHKDVAGDEYYNPIIEFAIDDEPICTMSACAGERLILLVEENLITS